MENYTGITISGLISTPHAVNLYINGELKESIDTNRPKGIDCRKEATKARKILNEKLKLHKLESKLSELETKLYEEKKRIHSMLNDRGWGYGMRCNKIGYSDSKEDRLNKRIKEIETKISEQKKVIEFGLK